MSRFNTHGSASRARQAAVPKFEIDVQRHKSWSPWTQSPISCEPGFQCNTSKFLMEKTMHPKQSAGRQEITRAWDDVYMFC